MLRLSKKQIQEIESQVKDYPMPGQLDVDRARVAAMTCENIQEIADFLEIDLVTFKVWATKSKSFYAAINSWETMATLNIKKAMAKRAIGFTKKTKRDVLTKTGQVETLTVETYYPPSETAGQFWLKNKAPEEFQDKREIDVNLNANIRAWLVSAGGAIDPSEIIEGVSQPVETNLTTNVIESLINAELEDHSQQELEATLISDLIAEQQPQPELQPSQPPEQPSSNTFVPTADKPAPGSPYAGFNSKWD